MRFVTKEKEKEKQNIKPGLFNRFWSGNFKKVVSFLVTTNLVVTSIAPAALHPLPASAQVPSPGLVVQVLDAANLAAKEEGNRLTQPTTPKTVDLPDKEIEDLTTEEIRQLLNEAGVSNDILDQITDEELKDLVNETLIAN